MTKGFPHGNRAHSAQYSTLSFRQPSMSSRIDPDELVRRISRDLADGYDEELELEIEDRHRLPERVAGRGYRRGKGLPARLFPATLPPPGGAREAAGLGGRHAAKGSDPVRRTRCRRQGRRHQAHQSETQSARVPRGGAAGAQRSRAHAVVLPALRAALSGGRRNRSVRPQLVQPCGRRARDGVLHAPRSTRSSSARCPSSSACSCARASSC